MLPLPFPGTRLACVTNKGNCHVYNLTTNEGRTVVDSNSRRKIPAHKRYALKCKFSPDSSMLATCSADQTTKIWRTADYSLITVSAVPENGMAPPTDVPCWSVLSCSEKTVL